MPYMVVSSVRDLPDGTAREYRPTAIRALLEQARGAMGNLYLGIIRDEGNPPDRSVTEWNAVIRTREREYMLDIVSYVSQ